jgi:CheY-like chemotaxis protein
MDVHMPVMDGYQATARIRALASPHAKNVPIVAMTANVFREDIELCLKAGMNAHLGKPMDFEAIREILKKYL